MCWILGDEHHCRPLDLRLWLFLCLTYIAHNEDFNEMYVFFQLIILRPHPHFARHIRKKIRKTIRILHVWKSASPQIRILPEARIYRNVKLVAELANQRFSAVKDERDLGVIVDKSLKSSRQCAKAAAAANAVLGMIRRTFLCKGNELILQLYKSLVRPRIEYCVQAWRRYLKKDINVLERVQERATKLISGLSEMENTGFNYT